jgi:hypothetical protein
VLDTALEDRHGGCGVALRQMCCREPVEKRRVARSRFQCALVAFDGGVDFAALFQQTRRLGKVPGLLVGRGRPGGHRLDRDERVLLVAECGAQPRDLAERDVVARIQLENGVPACERGLGLAEAVSVDFRERRQFLDPRRASELELELPFEDADEILPAFQGTVVLGEGLERAFPFGVELQRLFQRVGRHRAIEELLRVDGGDALEQQGFLRGNDSKRELPVQVVDQLRIAAEPDVDAFQSAERVQVLRRLHQHVAVAARGRLGIGQGVFLDAGDLEEQLAPRVAPERGRTSLEDRDARPQIAFASEQLRQTARRMLVRGILR